MESKNVREVLVLLEIPEASINQIIQPPKVELICKGSLKFAQIKQEDTTVNFIQVGDFTYTLYNEIPIYVTAYEKCRSYIFPMIDGFYVLIIEDKFSNNYDIVEAILGDIGTLIYKSADKDQKPSEQLKDKVQQIEEKLEQDKIEVQKQEQLKQPKEQEQLEPENKFASFIRIGGGALASGIQMGAGYLTKGIQVSSNYIEGKITNQKELHFSDKTKKNVQSIKETSGKVMNITADAAKTIIDANVNLAKKAGNYIVSKVQKDDKDKPPSKNTIFFKQIGQASLQAAVQVLDSLDEASSQVGNEIGQSSKKIVEKKYGHEASELFQAGTDTFGNVGKGYKEIKSMGIKSIAKKSAKETAKDVSDKIL